MRYLIIGLGIYGSNLATDLTAMGHEVIGADRDAQVVEALKDKISTAYILDATEEAALSVLPLKTVDLVIVAIGENFGASVKSVALLRKLGVKRIYARAVDEIHQTILEGFKVDRILAPEQRAAQELTRELELGCEVEAMRLDADHFVLSFHVPEYFVGRRLADLNLVKDFGMNLIAVARNQSKRNYLGIMTDTLSIVNDPADDFELQAEDVLTVLSTVKGFRDMAHYIK